MYQICQGKNIHNLKNYSMIKLFHTFNTEYPFKQKQSLRGLYCITYLPKSNVIHEKGPYLRNETGTQDRAFSLAYVQFPILPQTHHCFAYPPPITVKKKPKKPKKNLKMP